MAPEPILFVVAGIVVLIALAIAALSYMGAVNALAEFVRQGKPNGWIGGGPYRFWYGDKPRPIWSNWWIDNVMLGMGRLDISGEGYHALLRAARWRLLMCLALFAIFLIGLGWYTQGAMHIAPSSEVTEEYKALLARIPPGMKPQHASGQLEGAIPSTSLIQPKKPNPIVLPQGPHMATPDAQ